MTTIERRKHAVNAVPPFETVEEEAQFWDTNSVVDDIDKETAVGFHRGRNTDSLTIRLEPRTMLEIRERASQRGVSPAALVRTWIVERLRGGGSAHR